MVRGDRLQTKDCTGKSMGTALYRKGERCPGRWWQRVGLQGEEVIPRAPSPSALCGQVGKRQVKKSSAGYVAVVRAKGGAADLREQWEDLAWRWGEEERKGGVKRLPSSYKHQYLP